VYTDGSATNAIENGGGGIFIKLKDVIHTEAIATGRYCNNFCAEVAALKQAAETLITHKDQAEKQIVIFTDALSVITALKSQTNHELGSLIDSLERLACCFTKSTVQWIPAHCNVPGNEEADKLAKQGGALQQNDLGSTYEEAKTAIKASLMSKWKQDHPGHIKNDAYHQLSRQDQVIVFRLRTGHNRLRYHLYHKFGIGSTDQCDCGTGPMTAEHLLQICPSFVNERNQIWPRAIPLQEKLFGSAGSLRLTATFVRVINAAI
jgi:ribonuclease HI